MKFCSNCGNAVIFKDVPNDHRPRFVCDSCNTIHYQNPIVVTGALPVWEDKVLLCKRGIEPRKGFWNVPGGYLENGETVEEGAIREVWEEAKTKIVITSVHTVYSIPRINQVYIHFLAELLALDFQPTEESLEVQLFSEADIPWKEIAFPSSKFTLKHFFEDRKNGVRNTHIGKFENW